MKVTALWRYPVKSMGGERLETAEVTALGIEYDRAWGVVDTGTGLVLTGRREPRLLMAQAWVTDGELAIRTGDGAVLGGSLRTTSAAVSEWLGYAVEVRRAGEIGADYEVPLDVETEQEWFTCSGPAEAWHDSTRARVTLMSERTAAAHDPRRYRANVWLDGGPGAEDAWLGSEVRVGDARLDVTKQVERCVMVGREIPGAPADVAVTKWTIRERDNKLGIGAMVAAPGMVAVGDEARPGDTRSG